MACLRVCWGLKPRPRICKKPRARVRGKRTAFRMAAPTSMSTQAWAALSRSSTLYLQKIRDAMAELFMNIQEHKLKAIQAYNKTNVWQIALDETEEPFTLDKTRCATAHAMTIHLSLAARAMDSNLLRLDFVLPTSVIETTSAEGLNSALTKTSPHQVGGT